MRVPHALKLMLAAVVLAAGCTANRMPDGQPDQEEMEPDLDDVVTLFNEDLGPEGETVTRAQVDEAFEDEPEMLEIVLAELADLASETMARLISASQTTARIEPSNSLDG